VLTPALSVQPWIFTALIALAVTLPLLILIMWMRWGEDILDMLDFKDPPTAQGLEQGGERDYRVSCLSLSSTFL
jgi:hypothetical protein